MTIAVPSAPSMLPDESVARLGRRIAFLKNKGGVGNTFATIEIGQALARRGRRVLFVDMDPQGNLTRRLAVPDAEVAITTGEILAAKVRGGAAAGITRVGWPIPEAILMQAIPADLSLVDRDGEASVPGSHARLSRTLLGVTDDFDYTLFDCRPALGHLEQMVVRAIDGDTDGFFLVVEPEADAVSGAYRVREQVEAWADDMDIATSCLGVIVNRYDNRLVQHKGVTAQLSESLTPVDGGDPPRIMSPYIPLAARMSQLHHLGRPSTGDSRAIAEGHIAKLDALAEVIDR